MDRMKVIIMNIIYFVLDTYLIFLPFAFTRGIHYVLNFKYPTVTDNLFDNIFLQITIESLVMAYVVFILHDINRSIILYTELKNKDKKIIKLKERGKLKRYNQILFPYIMATLNLYFLYRVKSFYNIKRFSLGFIIILVIGVVITLYLYTMSKQIKKFYMLYDNTH